MGREHGEWTVLISPSRWATLEVDQGSRKAKEGKAKDDDDNDE